MVKKLTVIEADSTSQHMTEMAKVLKDARSVLTLKMKREDVLPLKKRDVDDNVPWISDSTTEIYEAIRAHFKTPTDLPENFVTRKDIEVLDDIERLLMRHKRYRSEKAVKEPWPSASATGNLFQEESDS